MTPAPVDDRPPTLADGVRTAYLRHRDENGLVRLSVLADAVACPDCQAPFPAALADVLDGEGFALVPDDDGHPCLLGGQLTLPVDVDRTVTPQDWDS